MLITVSDIPITGKHYSFDFESDAIDIIENYKYLEPVHFEGDIYKSSNDVRVIGRATVCLEVECARCLKVFGLPIDAKFEVFYRPYPSHTPKEAEVPFGELGTLYYRDNEINLGEAVRDTIILEIPMRSLCNEDCKGLCPHCGINLNFEKCDCKEEKVANNPFVDFFKNREKK